MLPSRKERPKEKIGIHPRNKHRERYDFKALIANYPELKKYVRLNEYGDESIDFSDPKAVMILNKALLKHYYKINHWSIPDDYLCPPVPGRADYIHHAADLLAGNNNNVIPKGSKINCLDIGVGANCIYPIIGTKEYEWSFVGSDIEPAAIQSATKIIESNASLKGKIELRLQANPKDIFNGIIHKEDRFDLTICNPPFHSSLEEAQSGTLRKLSNLNGKRITKPVLNFGGKNKELWCEGGEEKFLQKMVIQSKLFSSSCLWFSSLVSKSSNLESVYADLKNSKAFEIKTISMRQGNKISRVVAWTYLNSEEQKKWVNERWD